jgi:hypothetical protein
MLDPENCGTCGVQCGPTSTCNGGVCGPAPAMVSAAIAGCNGMTIVASDAVYFTDAVHGTVNKAGTATPLAMNELGATMIQQVGTNLYWYATSSKKIRKVAATGGAVTDVYTATLPGGGAPPDVAGFLVTSDGMSVYLSLGNQVLKASTAGTGTPAVVANEVKGGLPAALALNGTMNIVYPTTVNGDVDAPKLGGATPAECGMEDPANPGNAIMTTCPRLARSQGELFPNFVAVIAGKAYWIDGSNIKSETIAAVGTAFDIVSMVDNTITAAAATTDSIYFAFADPAMPADGGIAKAAAAVNTMNTPATLLARAQKAPGSVAVGATKVYWSTSDCAIMSQNR